MPPAILVLCTCPDDDTAETLAKQVLTSGLAACVNRLPGVQSTYHWAGRLETSQESLLIIKTLAAHYPALEALILSQHPYDCPEIIQLAIAGGSSQYLSWVTQNVQPVPSGQT